ncbi:MAG: PEP-CTERM sorting domain-containing protein [Opitutus sp.]|nr:PEP-CTERM sorting domain-containing protein [Opitutus sp.]MCS6247696.1 PEP-CTERM sorting domain-containing protein [Opitutus sp.]MCS6273016.1 PEP-CTERM sorting domain-containing protein [Opitutus sp.]MCS6276755.1 PEP-CTERM sorting domain-containing protein [Opitutus sp.]MCS6301596.1 PEP-CTERM sorting domain-containing protein [Opitutus sp.]
MKNSLKALFLASVVTASSAFAATTTDTFAAGDILLGFFTSTGVGAGSNLMVNLGSFGQFDNNDGSTVNFSSSIVSDLNATYGSDWNTRTDIKWSVTGATFAASVDGLTRNSIFATAVSGAAPIASASDGILGTVRSNVSSIGTAFNAFDTTANSTVSVVVASSNVNSMQARLTTNNSAQFGASNQNVTTATSVSDFYALVPTTGGTAPTGLATDGDGIVFARGTNYLGTFELKASGLSFTASGASAIPEPSTFGALAGAAVLGLAATRRRPAVRA